MFTYNDNYMFRRLGYSQEAAILKKYTNEDILANRISLEGVHFLRTPQKGN